MEKFIQFIKKDSLSEKDFYDDNLNKKTFDNLNHVLLDLFKKIGGNSFNNGLLRVHSFSSSFFWTDIVTTFFENYKNDCFCFAYDWMGRQFAYSFKNDIEKILMFDCCTGEVFEMNQTIKKFFNEDLVDYIDDTLDTLTFETFLKTNNINHLDPKKCISYKKPLFLGGIDTIENLEIADLEVNWEINYQIFCKIKKPNSANM